MNLADIDFSKTIVFGDIHYGLRNNSRDHNATCENFIKWTIDEAKEWGAKTCIFVGDFHHVRSAINISTLNYSVSGLKLLSEYFDHTVFLIGNHDLFYRDKIEIHSIPYIDQFKNIHLIDRITEVNDIAFVPWLMGDDWKQVQHIKSPYIFGHFELPSFKMNAMIEMVDLGMLNKSHFIGKKQVFSGHFHKRQNQGIIWYIGNCFPHDYSDAGDEDNRGIMYWEPGLDPKFKSFPGSPKYRVLTLSQVMSDPTRYIDENTYARISIDVAINYEEANFIKELFETELKAKSVHLITKRIDELDVDENANINFESVDSIVISHLQSIESNTVDRQELINIYQSI
jgi:hypothetical protein